MEAVVGAIIAGIVALIGGYISNSVTNSHNKKTEELAEDNLNFNKETAAQNFELSQDQFEYQKKLNELTMQREDTAFQRQVADLQAAGLSPLNIAGGASATPLTSANAPQFDVSGINQAAQGLIGAYNDSFNRKLTSRQFALQAKSQTAQIYTQLAENYRDQKQAQLEYEYLDQKLKWEKIHGFRDVDWKSDLTQAIEKALSKNGSSVLPSIDSDTLSNARDKVAKTVENVMDKATYSDEENFRDYGSVSKYTKYGHTLDNENYDNNRSTAQLIKEEAKEKALKIALAARDSEKTRSNLYDTDDYLKKHISKENWLKMSRDFVKYYLKNGMFEDHKKYFD